MRCLNQCRLHIRIGWTRSSALALPLLSETFLHSSRTFEGRRGASVFHQFHLHARAAISGGSVRRLGTSLKTSSLALNLHSSSLRLASSSSLICFHPRWCAAGA